MKKLTFTIIGVVFIGCAYTFSGSSLPSNIKTVEIPLFENSALVQGVAERITEVLSQKASREKLTVVAKNGDSYIGGNVVYYKNSAQDYSGDRNSLTIKTHSVEIVADIVFFDNKNGKEIYKGRIISIGNYDFSTETEEDGRSRAIDDITEKILQNSIKSW
ncbi:MAG: LPS assembly lipoprotein LptE [Chitinispirillales bacterium]|jgi:hypothetical protein|nr:LPS assembly lipoprotein LptE [Chitinispirillales bacterium]